MRMPEKKWRDAPPKYDAGCLPLTTCLYACLSTPAKNAIQNPGCIASGPRLRSSATDCDSMSLRTAITGTGGAAKSVEIEAADQSRSYQAYCSRRRPGL